MEIRNQAATSTIEHGRIAEVGFYEDASRGLDGLDPPGPKCHVLPHLRRAWRTDFKIKMKSCDDRTSPIIATSDNTASS
jgi:hypothetical protein